MKQVIDGLLYDTTKAERIASTSYSNRTDFDYYAEDLCKTKNGRYFLAGEGHARSRYGKRVDKNTWGPGEGIVPLEKEQALAWCEHNDVEPDIVMKEFDIIDA